MQLLLRRKWQITPTFLPGESHGQRSLLGYSLWGHKQSDTTERLLSSLSFFMMEIITTVNIWLL